MVGGVKAVILLLALVLMTGCGKKEPELRSEKVITPGEAANKLFVEAVELVSQAKAMESTDLPSAIKTYEKALGKIRKIVSDYKESDIAVKLVGLVCRCVFVVCLLFLVLFVCWLLGCWVGWLVGLG